MPVEEASVSTVKALVKFGKASTGAEMRAFFKVSKHVSVEMSNEIEHPFSIGQ